MNYNKSIIGSQMVGRPEVDAVNGSIAHLDLSIKYFIKNYVPADNGYAKPIDKLLSDYLRMYVIPAHIGIELSVEFISEKIIIIKKKSIIIKINITGPVSTECFEAVYDLTENKYLGFTANN